jgi:hypothetical protein
VTAPPFYLLLPLSFPRHEEKGSCWEEKRRRVAALSRRAKVTAAAAVRGWFGSVPVMVKYWGVSELSYSKLQYYCVTVCAWVFATEICVLVTVYSKHTPAARSGVLKLSASFGDDGE